MEEYLTRSKSYPITNFISDIETTSHEIVEKLRHPFTRAVVLRDPRYKLNPLEVQAREDKSLAQKYWSDPNEIRGRKASGRIVHTAPITDRDTTKESEEAGIIITPNATSTFTTRANELRNLFTIIFARYTGIQDAIIRGSTLFTPLGGRGRSPELHVDNLILTLHWSAALATFPVHDGELPPEIWSSLDRTTQNNMSTEQRTLNHETLVHLAQKLHMTENQVGDVMITKGQLNRDLTNPAHQQEVCVHASSLSIIQNGQAGFIFFPKTPSPAA